MEAVFQDIVETIDALARVRAVFVRTFPPGRRPVLEIVPIDYMSIDSYARGVDLPLPPYRRVYIPLPAQGIGTIVATALQRHAHESDMSIRRYVVGVTLNSGDIPENTIDQFAPDYPVRLLALVSDSPLLLDLPEEQLDQFAIQTREAADGVTKTLTVRIPIWTG